MLGELGHFVLILALLIAITQGILPLLGGYQNNIRLMRFASAATFTQAAMVLIAFAILTILFIQQDFSIAYVAQNSNLRLPILYRFSAVWGAHEGSLLLWALILSIWSALVAWRIQDLPLQFQARVLGILGLISTGFLSFMVFTSNPFLRHIPRLADGADLNPLLQDPGLIIHPPMLYMGYVGFAVPFAFALAALMHGKFDSQIARWMRPWTLAAWSFLTFGIALGSWWAYYELGWGGWWFWDPVENASFMPWLIGGALIHSLAVSDKRGTFRAWTLLLAIFAFALSLLGTFLVRSGVITSVHAFASDPSRGLFILAFLLVVIGGALTIYAIRAPKLGDPETGFSTVSRESFIMINNLALVAAAAMILLGTLYPLLIEALGKGKLSVGSPYFGGLFVPLMAPIVLLLPFGPFAKWRHDAFKTLFQSTRLALILALVFAVLAYFVFETKSWRVIAGALGSVWIIAGVLSFVWRLARDPQRRAALRFGGVLGMSIAHLGVGLFVIGALFTDVMSIEKDVRMQAGDEITIGKYRFKLDRFDHVEGPNYVADAAHVLVYRGDELVTEMIPQKRAYSGGQVMTEAALHPGLIRDFYVAMGEPLDDGAAWAVRIYVKPFIRFIWLGALLMMAGGFIAATDRRYSRLAATVPKTDAVVAEAI